jgi:hypothetical protein
MYRVAYRMLVALLVVCLSLVVGLLVVERTGFIEIDEKEIQPEVVSCQIGHNDMEVSVQGSGAAYRGEVVPRYEFWLSPFGGCAVYYWDKPYRGLELAHPPNILRHQARANFGEFRTREVRGRPRQRNVTGTAPEAYRYFVLSTSHKRNSPKFITL